MAYRKEKFENGDIAHVMLRGVEGIKIFKDIDDYYRGIFSIYEFNNLNSVSIYWRRKILKTLKKRIQRGPSSLQFMDERERMVDVLSFCFMPNHIHLLIRQIQDNGITKFMSKMGTGYGGYFNRKNKRQGHIFQTVFVATKIKTDDQARVVFAYIHANPISLIYKDWKSIRMGNKDFNKIAEFLEKYKWSSYPDYIGIQNFPSVTQRKFLLDLFGGERNCKEFVEDYIKNKGESKEVAKLFLE